MDKPSKCMFNVHTTKLNKIRYFGIHTHTSSERKREHENKIRKEKATFM